MAGWLATAALVAAGGCSASAAGTEQQPAASSHHPIVSEPPAAPLRAGERFLSLSMSKPYTPQPTGGGTDEYRCFLVDPKLTAATYLTGSQFLPQNAEIVHHAIFFRVAPGEVAEAKQLDAQAPGEGWRCFGGTGIGGTGPSAQLSGGASWVAAWAPGGGENLVTPGTGYPLAAGSQLVMQVHYSLLATGGKSAGTDKSGIKLRLVDRGTGLTALQTKLLTAPVELPCAANESGQLCDRNTAVLNLIHRFGDPIGATVAGLNAICNGGRTPVAGVTQHCDRPVRQAGKIYAVAGHMHLLGKSIKVELNPGTPAAKTLLNIPVYNFDDQRARPMATPVAVKPGDTLRVTCTHDATLRQRLPALRTLPPRYVVWGDGTADEMCLGVVVWSQT